MYHCGETTVSDYEWNNTSTKWFILPMIADDKQRQNEINKKIKQAMVKWYQYSVMKSETLLHTVGIFFLFSS